MVMIYFSLNSYEQNFHGLLFFLAKMLSFLTQFKTKSAQISQQNWSLFIIFPFNYLTVKFSFNAQTNPYLKPFFLQKRGHSDWLLVTNVLETFSV